MENILKNKLEQTKFLIQTKKKISLEDFKLLIYDENYDGLNYIIDYFNLSNKDTNNEYDKMINIILESLNMNIIKFFHLKGFKYPNDSFSKILKNDKNNNDNLISLIQSIILNMHIDENDIIQSIFDFNEVAFDFMSLHDYVFEKLPKKINFDKRIKHCFKENENDGFEKNKDNDIDITFLNKILLFLQKYSYFDFFYERLYMYFLQTYIDSYNEKYYTFFSFVLNFIENNNIKFSTYFYSNISLHDKLNIYDKFCINILYLLNSTKPDILDLFYGKNNKNKNLIPYFSIYFNKYQLITSSYYKKNIIKFGLNKINHFNDLYQYLDYWVQIVSKYPNLFKEHYVIDYIIQDIEFKFNNILKTGNENKDQINKILFMFKKIIYTLPNLFTDNDYFNILEHIAYHNLHKYKIFDMLPEFKEPKIFFEKHLNNYYYIENYSEYTISKIIEKSSLQGIYNLLNYILHIIDNDYFMEKMNYLKNDNKKEKYLFVIRHRIDIFKLTFDIFIMKINENKSMINYLELNECLNDILIHSDKLIRYFEDIYIEYFFEKIEKIKYLYLIEFLIEYAKSERKIENLIIKNILQKCDKQISFPMLLFLLNK